MADNSWSMPLIRSIRLPQIVSVLGLLVFVLGSNHCLIEGSRGHREMACLALPDAPAAGSCCHAASKPSESPSHSTRDRSCCIDPAPLPATASLDAADAIGPMLAWIAPADLDPAHPRLTVAADWTPFGSPPPTTSPPLPPSSRGPPLA